MKVQVKEFFPYDLAFAMTVHNAQARTISGVVVDLTCHPRLVCCMKYGSIFVAMSCVQRRDHNRLLEKPTAFRQSQSSEYLEYIKPERYIAPFFHGYSTDGSQWHPAYVLTYSAPKH